MAETIGLWDLLPNPATTVRFVSPESVKARKAASGRLLGRLDRPSVHHSAAELENRLPLTARTRPSTRNSFGAPYLEKPHVRLFRFWTVHLFDSETNWRETQPLPFANQVANLLQYPAVRPRRSRVR